MTSRAEPESGNLPPFQALRWYRWSLLALAAAFLLQILLGWLFVGFAALSLLPAAAAPLLAIRGMLLFRSEMGRLGAGARALETRRTLRALRAKDGPIILIAVVSALLILVALINIRALMLAKQSFGSLFGAAESPEIMTVNVIGLLNAVRMVSLMIWLGAAAGIVAAFLRLRRIRREMNQLPLTVA